MMPFAASSSSTRTSWTRSRCVFGSSWQRTRMLGWPLTVRLFLSRGLVCGAGGVRGEVQAPAIPGGTSTPIMVNTFQSASGMGHGGCTGRRR